MRQAEWKPAQGFSKNSAERPSLSTTAYWADRTEAISWVSTQGSYRWTAPCRRHGSSRVVCSGVADCRHRLLAEQLRPDVGISTLFVSKAACRVDGQQLGVTEAACHAVQS